MTVGVRESAILGFTGTSRVLLSFSHALVLVLPLMALIALAPAVQRARDDGSLELLFSQPLSPGAVAPGGGGRALPGPRPPAGARDDRRRVVGPASGTATRCRGSSSAARWRWPPRCSWPSPASAPPSPSSCASPARVITYVILVWALGVALLDFGLIGAMLRWRLDPHAVFSLAMINPVEAARLALLSSCSPTSAPSARSASTWPIASVARDAVRDRRRLAGRSRASVRSGWPTSASAAPTGSSMARSGAPHAPRPRQVLRVPRSTAVCWSRRDPPGDHHPAGAVDHRSAVADLDAGPAVPQRPVHRDLHAQGRWREQGPAHRRDQHAQPLHRHAQDRSRRAGRPRLDPLRARAAHRPDPALRG
jgi:hypothetical protein